MKDNIRQVVVTEERTAVLYIKGEPDDTAVEMFVRQLYSNQILDMSWIRSYHLTNIVISNPVNYVTGKPYIVNEKVAAVQSRDDFPEGTEF